MKRVTRHQYLWYPIEGNPGSREDSGANLGGVSTPLRHQRSSSLSSELPTVPRERFLRMFVTGAPRKPDGSLLFAFSRHFPFLHPRGSCKQLLARYARTPGDVGEQLELGRTKVGVRLRLLPIGHKCMTLPLHRHQRAPPMHL